MNRRAVVWLLSVGIGIVYGLLFRFTFGQRNWQPQGATWIMTIAFLSVVPFAMGYLGYSYLWTRVGK